MTTDSEADPRYDVAAWTNGSLAWAKRMEESKINPKRSVPSEIVPLAKTEVGPVRWTGWD